MTDGLAVDIATALGTALAGLSLGAFRADGSAFAAGEINVIAVGRAPESAGTSIGLTPYAVSDNAGGGDGVLGIQVWFRGATRDIRPVLNMQGVVFEYLQGKQQYQLGGHPVSVSWRQVTSPQGPDSAGRYQIADSYYFATNRPVAESFD